MSRSTAIPHQATASIDVRLVAGMNMDTICRQIVEHVQDRCPGAQVELIHGYEAYKVAVTHPEVQKVVGAVRDLCRSMGENGPPVILPTMGGSLPWCEDTGSSCWIDFQRREGKASVGAGLPANRRR